MSDNIEGAFEHGTTSSLEKSAKSWGSMLRCQQAGQLFAAGIRRYFASKERQLFSSILTLLLEKTSSLASAHCISSAAFRVIVPPSTRRHIFRFDRGDMISEVAEVFLSASIQG